MLQTMLIFSPFIVLFIVGLACLALGLRSYRIRQEKLTKELSERTLLFLAFGNAGLGAFCFLVLLLIRSHAVLLISLFCVVTLFLFGELMLRRFIICRRDYFFVSSVTMLSAFLCLLLFPVVSNIHEPFTLIASAFTVLLIVIQAILISNWKRMRMPEGVVLIPAKDVESGEER